MTVVVVTVLSAHIPKMCFSVAGPPRCVKCIVLCCLTPISTLFDFGKPSVT